MKPAVQREASLSNGAADSLVIEMAQPDGPFPLVDVVFEAPTEILVPTLEDTAVSVIAPVVAAQQNTTANANGEKPISFNQAERVELRQRTRRHSTEPEPDASSLEEEFLATLQAQDDYRAMMQSHTKESFFAGLRTDNEKRIASFIFGGTESTDPSTIAHLLLETVPHTTRRMFSEILSADTLRTFADPIRVAELQKAFLGPEPEARPEPRKTVLQIAEGIISELRPGFSVLGKCVGLSLTKGKRGKNTEFFPARGQPMEKQRELCRECPVDLECLTYSIENNIKFGVWGGSSERQRREVRKVLNRFEQSGDKNLLTKLETSKTMESVQPVMKRYVRGLLKAAKAKKAAA